MDDIFEQVEKQITEDSSFQDEIKDLADDEKSEKVESKRKEILRTQFSATKADSEKHEKAFNDQKTRAEKAERERDSLKESGGAKDAPLTSEELYTLMEAKIPSEDIETVRTAARLLGKPIAEALKDDIIVAQLARRVDERKTAAATDTGNGRRGPEKISDEEIIAKAAGGWVPEKGSPEAEQLFWARSKRKGRK